MPVIKLMATSPVFENRIFLKRSRDLWKHLRRLRFAITVFFQEPDPLVEISDELEEISGKNKLECIEIDLKVRHPYDARYEWDRLEEVLIKSGWPELKCVSITVIFEFKHPGAFNPLNLRTFERALRSLQHTQFPRLRQNKHLDVQFSVECRYWFWPILKQPPVVG